jgi:hypothetical protein
MNAPFSFVLARKESVMNMRKLAAMIVASGAVVIALDPTAGAQPASPKIVAKPDSVMVNTVTKLTGRYFPPNSKLTIEECSETNWIVPQNPCDTTNVIHVKTNASGTFVHKLTAEVCPGASAAPGFAEICYVGEPKPQGVDTIALVGAEQITVTGP